MTTEKKKFSKKEIRDFIITIIAFIIIVAVRYIPAPSGLSADGMQVLGIFVGVLLLWLTVGITWPSLVCIVAIAFVPSIGIATALSESFGNPIFAFLLFTFMLTYALSKTGFIKRIALWFVTSRLARKGPWYLATMFLTSVLLLGLVMSPTVLFFIIMPILEEIYKVLKIEKGDKFANMLMIGTVTVTSLSSGMTTIAHVFPTLALGAYETATGIVISQFAYMGFAIPAGILIFVLMMIVFRFIMRPKTAHIKEMDFTVLEKSKAEIPKVNRGEIIILVTFLVVVLLWILPGFLGIFPGLSSVVKYINKHIGTAIPPLVGVILLCIIRQDKKPLLNFNEAITKGVSWPALIMSASTLALSAAITHGDVGLTNFLSLQIEPLTRNLPGIIMALIFVAWAALQSNVSSHMVTSTLVSTLAVTVAVSSQGVLNPAAIAAVVGFVASTGSATPPSMPYVAVAGASEWSNTKNLAQYGFLMMAVVIVVATFVAYPLAGVIV